MTLHLTCTACVVCERDVGDSRDTVDLDNTDEDGIRWSSLFGYKLPPARFRDRIAPGLCDHCWAAHRAWMMSRRYRNSIPPFHSVYLWAWVRDRLEEQARRLSPHYARKAEVGLAALSRVR